MEEQIEAVQRMQDYIDTHLTENITLVALAEVSYFRHGILIGYFCSIQT